jgi:hypothetical protein
MATALALACALAFALATVPRAAQVQTPPPIAVACTFSNQSYAGDCVEKTTRTEKQKPADACQPIVREELLPGHDRQAGLDAQEGGIGAARFQPCRAPDAVPRAVEATRRVAPTRYSLLTTDY